jgi:CRP-like cAMP-binding protein
MSNGIAQPTSPTVLLHAVSGQSGTHLSPASALRYWENRLLAALPPEAAALLEPGLKEVSAPQGTVFLEPGQPIEHVYFPLSGMISLLVLTKNGEMIETSSVGHEGAVGLHSGLGERRAFTRAVVQVAGRFAFMPATAFRGLTLDSPALRDMIARYTEVLWAEAQQIAACNAVHDASSRLCRWLLQSVDRAGTDQLTLTQEFLAQMLGVRRTTVTILAIALQRKKFIKYSRGKISILDRSGLEAGACECHRVIQHDALPARIGVEL